MEIKKLKQAVACILAMIICLTGCTADSADVTDQIANVAQAEDEHVLSVKNATNSNYPGVTYGEAFEKYFKNPTWKYFTGTKEGTDEDGDGKPDAVSENEDVVEFTGYCYYQEVEVKALVQFTLNDDDTFEATYLSFNEVPQNMLVLAALIDNALSAGVGTTEATEEATSEQAEKSDKEKKHLGDTITVETKDGGKIEVTLTDCGVTKSGYSSDGEICIYIGCEFKNVGEKSVGITAEWFQFYADNHLAETDLSQGLGYTELSSGREIEDVVYALLDPETASVIEVEIGNNIFALKDSDINDLQPKPTDGSKDSEFDAGWFREHTMFMSSDGGNQIEIIFYDFDDYFDFAINGITIGYAEPYSYQYDEQWGAYIYTVSDGTAFGFKPDKREIIVLNGDYVGEYAVME